MESSWKDPNSSRRKHGPMSPDFRQSIHHSEFKSDNPFYNNTTDQNYEKLRGPLRAKTGKIDQQALQE